jgi:hypothetical protein
MKILRCAVPMLLLALTTVSNARADGGSPIQISLFNPVQIVPETKSVKGVRLNLIYGKNADVTGLDYGLVNQTTGNEGALQIGLVNLAYNSTEDGHGVQWGWVNRSRNMRGLQVGLVNFTETMHGVQVGVANIIQKGKIPFLPIVNWSF